MPALGVGERAKVCAERDAEMTARHFPFADELGPSVAPSPFKAPIQRPA
jgi:hypothetical protein